MSTTSGKRKTNPSAIPGAGKRKGRHSPAARQTGLLSSWLVASVALLLALAAMLVLAQLAGMGYAAIGAGVIVALWMLWRRFASPAVRQTNEKPSVGVRIALGVAIAGLTWVSFFWGSGANIAPAVTCATLAGGAAYFEPIIERFLRRWRMQWPIILVGSAILGYALLGGTLDARWYIIDDHDYMAALGPEGNCRLGDIPARLMETEIGRFPSSDRFRPTYQLGRIFEAFLWGDNSRMYWIEHLAFFIIGIALYWRFLSRWLGLVSSAFLILYLMAWDFWAGIWCRLGPSEIYCFLSLAMYLVGIAGVLREYRAAPHKPGKWAWGHWVLLTVAAIITIGAKESFVIFVLPSLILAGVLIKRRRFGVPGIVSTILVVGMTAFVALPIVSFLRASGGEDFYHREVKVPGLMSYVMPGLSGAIQPVSWLGLLGAILLVAAAIALLGSPRQLARTGRRLLWPSVIAAGLVAVYVSQMVFYKGEFPVQFVGLGRYNFPGLLVKPLLVVTAAVFGLAMLKRLGVNPYALRAFRVALVGGLVILTMAKGYGTITNQANGFASQSADWTRRLDLAVEKMRKDPTRPVVFYSYNSVAGGDYEPVLSIQRFLAVRGVSNPLFLKTADYRAIGLRYFGRFDQSDQQYAEYLRKISIEGIESPRRLNTFRPLDQLPSRIDPFVIGLSAPPESGHHDLGLLFP